jgi:hypothetical protein
MAGIPHNAHSEEELAAAEARLLKLGKTHDDIRAYLRACKDCRNDKASIEDLIASAGTPLQRMAMLELASLHALWDAQRGAAKVAPDAHTELALIYAGYRNARVLLEAEQELGTLLDEIAPDYRHGKEMREGREKAYGTKEDRRQQAIEFHKIKQRLRRPSNQLIAERYNKQFPNCPEKHVISKTVERRLNDFADDLESMGRPISPDDEK